MLACLKDLNRGWAMNANGSQVQTRIYLGGVENVVEKIKKQWVAELSGSSLGLVKVHSGDGADCDSIRDRFQVRKHAVVMGRNHPRPEDSKAQRPLWTT